jgi:hypothetical protein
MERIESQIAEWRAFVGQGPAVDGRDVEELEAHLRDQINDLIDSDLAPDEAFIIAAKRMGSIDDLSQEFAREHSGRLWRQLVVSGGEEAQGTGGSWVEAVAFAIAAGVAIHVVRLVSGFPGDESFWLLRNAGLFVLPFLAAYFARRRQLSLRECVIAAGPFVIAAVVINVYPFTEGSATELLVAAHLPVALWFAVAYPYMGGVLSSHERRMDFVRFTGEWFIYYVLIALGGGVLMGLTALILEPIGPQIAESVIEWILPAGVVGAVIVAAWLVGAKQRVVENMAPVLTMIFTPLFALMLAGAAVVYLFTGLGGAFNREMLVVFDALMVVVLGLVLYGMSARDSSAPPGWMDRIQLVAVVSALALDVVVLGAMIARIGDLGFTPNRVAALGLNILLLVSLSGSAWLSARFLTGRATFHQLERWQTTSLPAFAIWVAAVVLIFPPVFGFT